MKDSFKGQTLTTGWLGNASTIGGLSTHDNGMLNTNVITTDTKELFTSQYDSQYGTQQFNEGQFGGVGMGFDNRYLVQDSTLLHTWQTNGRYLQQVMLFYS